MLRLHPVVTIVGPTAVGKSRLALELAATHRAEIISADSRQVYRYMDIGTDKPTREQQLAVRHHVIDVVAPDDTYSAQRFQREGSRILRRLHAQARLAIVVGGTGYYVNALMDSALFPEVPPDDEFRAALAHEADDAGPEELHRRLAGLDPASAERIHPRNTPRIIRALEIVRATGSPIPETRAEAPIPSLRIGLRKPRRELWAAADMRALEQVRAGLPEETRLLLEMGYGAEIPSMQGFGYRQMVAYLRGDLSLGEALDAYRIAQRRYIRRQMTWFGRDPRIVWLDANEDPYSQAEKLVAEWLTFSDA